MTRLCLLLLIVGLGLITVGEVLAFVADAASPLCLY